MRHDFSGRLCFCLFLIVIPECLEPIQSSTRSTVSVFVTDDRGLQIQDVQIILEARHSVYTIPNSGTDRNGRVLLVNIPTGEYHLIAKKRGFRPVLSPWFKLTPQSIFQIRITLLPELPGVNPVPIEKSIVIYNQTSPAISFQPRYESSLPLGQSDSRDHLTLFPILWPPQYGNIGGNSSGLTDTRAYLDGIPLSDPLDRKPLLIPPGDFCDSVRMTVSGMDSDYEVSWGPLLEFVTREPDPSIVSGTLLWQRNVANTTMNASPEAYKERSAWETQNGTIIDNPAWSESSESNTAGALLSVTTRPVSILSHLSWQQSTCFPGTDYINPDAFKKSSIWVKTTSSLSPGWSIDGYFGLEDRWERDLYAFYLRGYSGFMSHDVRQFAALASNYRTSGGLFYRLVLSHMSRESNAAPPDGSYDFIDPFSGDSSGNLRDIQLVRDGASSVSRIQLNINRDSSQHGLEAGAGFQQIDVSWDEAFRTGTGGSGEPVLGRQVDFSDWEFNLWGHDRWFPTRNIELGIMMRFDRFHYFENSDHLTPRFNASYFYRKFQFSGGVERIIEPPAVALLFESVSRENPGEDNPAAYKPASGFRWYAGVERSFFPKAKIRIDAYLASMYDPALLFLEDQTEVLRFFAPVSSYKKTKTGMLLQADWTPVGWFTMHFWYSLSRSEANYPLQSPESSVQTYMDSRFPTLDIDPSSPDLRPEAFDLTHVIKAVQVFHFDLWGGIDAGLVHSICSGQPYTPLYRDPADPSHFYYGRINSRRGPLHYQMDVSLAKQFALGRLGAIELKVSLINAFDELFSSYISPWDGTEEIDPFTSKTGLPRTLFADLKILF